MEKFYRITDASPVKAQYLESEKNKSVFFKRLADFQELHGVKELGALGDGLYMESSAVTHEFEKQLTAKVTPNGFRKFKVNSPLAKEWANYIKDIVKQNRSIPWAFMFRNLVGRHSYLAFEHNGEVYLHFAAYEVDFADPEGFEEIKGSEYHAMREAENARRAELRKASA